MCVKVKVCGLRTQEDVRAVNEALPDYAGFIFVSGRKRFVSPGTAAALRRALAPSITPVAVFVNETIDGILRMTAAARIDTVQLHGQETDAYIRELRGRSGGRLKIIKAFRVESEGDVRAAEECAADVILLDNGAGGTGETFRWENLRGIKRKFILAGGIGPDNVAQAIRLTGASGVDASSLLETDGHKDRGKILKFVRAAREPGKEGDMNSNSRGRFGVHGGQYIPETLMNAVIELEDAYNRYKDDPQFNAELKELLDNYAGRPSRLYYAQKLSRDLGGAKIYLKREDLNHTGAHKINNCLGQALLAKKMGKTRLIAETGAGQHGVATATVAALMGMECVVFMGRVDMERQALNVYKMRLLGADVQEVDSGTGTLKDAVSQAMREWTSRIDDTHYCLGSCMGPHPFPTIVRDFQSVISREARQQILEKEGRLPDAVLACVGGGSNAIGSFYHFIPDKSVKLIGCEAAGRGIDTDRTAATINTGSLGIFHGMKSYFCQDAYGQIAPVYSISAGLDYPGVGPEHAYLHDIGRAQYVGITDDEAVNAFEYLCREEGIIPAIESAHAVAYAMKLAPTMRRDQIIIVTISGRGDKDCAAIARYRGEDIHD
jgi:phosphoribosylanthranilate isomerase